MSIRRNIFRNIKVYLPIKKEATLMKEGWLKIVIEDNN
jgi:hypothetical protein